MTKYNTEEAAAASEKQESEESSSEEEDEEEEEEDEETTTELDDPVAKAATALKEEITKETEGKGKNGGDLKAGLATAKRAIDMAKQLIAQATAEHVELAEEFLTFNYTVEGNKAWETFVSDLAHNCPVETWPEERKKKKGLLDALVSLVQSICWRAKQAAELLIPFYAAMINSNTFLEFQLHVIAKTWVWNFSNQENTVLLLTATGHLLGMLEESETKEEYDSLVSQAITKHMSTTVQSIMKQSVPGNGINETAEEYEQNMVSWFLLDKIVLLCVGNMDIQIAKSSEETTDSDDENEDETSTNAFSTTLASILEGITSGPAGELQREFVQEYHSFITQLAVEGKPTACAGLSKGEDECTCSYESHVRLRGNAATLIQAVAKYLVPRQLSQEINTLLAYFKCHPTSEWFSLLISLYPYCAEAFVPEFDALFDKLHHDDYCEDFYGFVARAARLNAARLFHENHVSALEAKMATHATHIDSALDALQAIAENHNKLFEGRGAEYFEVAMRWDGDQEQLCFRIGAILKWRAMISEDEATEAINIMINRGYGQFPMSSVKKDILEHMATIVLVHPRAVRLRRNWVIKCERDAMVRKEARMVLMALEGGGRERKGKVNGSRACIVL